MNWVLVGLGAYLAVQLGIGVWLAPRMATEEDYLVGGRRMGYPLTVFSILATWFGAESCIASAGRVYAEGFSLTSAEPFAYGLTLVAMGLVFAVPLWKRRLTTFADLFRQRYGPGVERLAAILLVPSGLLWAAAQLRGFGQVITTVTDVDINLAIAGAAVFCVSYTMLGGFLADAMTDLIQGAVLIVGLLLLAGAVAAHHGGAGPALASIDIARVMLVDPATAPSFLALIEEWAVPIAGSVVAVELVSRVIAARSPAVARNGALIGGGLYIMIGAVPVFIGLAASSLVTGVADPEQFLPLAARQLLSPVAYVVFIGALISAILSTVDTILLVGSGLITHNVVAPALGITTDRTRLRMARFGVVVLGVCALLLAQRAAGVGALVEEASSFGSAGILVVVSFALFSSIGGPVAAGTTLLGGLGAYLWGAAVGAPYPFLGSVAASVIIYLATAAVERTRRP
jgi:Na+/proline symporter